MPDDPNNKRSGLPDVSFLPRPAIPFDNEVDIGGEDQEATSPIDRCPFCAYDLRFGRPPYRCPECGFEYDDQSRVWWDSRDGAGYGNYWMFALTAVGLGGFMAYRFWIGTARLEALFFLAMAMGGATYVAHLVFRLRRSYKLGRCIVASPRGLFVRSQYHEDFIPWQSFGDLVFSKMGFYVRQLDKTQTVEIPMGFDAFEDEDDWIEFRQELHQFRTYYLDRDDGRGESDALR